MRPRRPSRRGLKRLRTCAYPRVHVPVVRRPEACSFSEYVRATALLAITSIQQGDIQRMQQHLGNYITLSTTIGLYDERRWPNTITAIEVEERRRLVSRPTL